MFTKRTDIRKAIETTGGSEVCLRVLEEILTERQATDFETRMLPPADDEAVHARLLQAHAAIEGLKRDDLGGALAEIEKALAVLPVPGETELAEAGEKP